MIEIEIPGMGHTLRLEHLVLDYNGTMAVDGDMIPGVREKLASLSSRITLHVLTADTFGKARAGASGLPCHVQILKGDNQAENKEKYVRRLGAETVVCIGNGWNDHLMLKAAALGIVLVQAEGASMKTLQTADIICPDIVSALSLLENHGRLIATLRR